MAEIPQVPERRVKVVVHENLGSCFAPDLAIQIGLLTLKLGEKFAVVLGDWKKEERDGEIVTVYTSADQTVCPPEIIQAAVHRISSHLRITVEDITE